MTELQEQNRPHGIRATRSQETLALTQQFGLAEATLSQLTTVSNFLSTYFKQTSG